jgi:hypothetical protein
MNANLILPLAVEIYLMISIITSDVDVRTPNFT